MTNLATQAFRRPVTAADVDEVMDFYDLGRTEKDFELGVEMAIARILASPQFIYRIEEEPASVKAGEAFRITDIDLGLETLVLPVEPGPGRGAAQCSRARAG